ncbi:BNR repeat domain protein [Enhygromyxa salina]|uniref:BNR repeat domain protein n=1 Tax=Enhygromyxa salina TaxID=215803 RepID=A0A0C1ZF99_9BACT|nr:hypothetical protein [Enhygromyxa salina]KIG16329.1 BNR repeat domain protein [Enhygromyxa salina]
MLARRTLVFALGSAAIACTPRTSATLDPAASTNTPELAAPETAETAATPKGTSRWIDISVESEFGCAVERTGSVFCWGRDPAADMGLREIPEQAPSTPQLYGARNWGPASRLELVHDARRISTASSRACVIVEGGRVRCWGSVRWGSQHVYDVPGITHAVDLEISDSESCAALAGGQLWCWSAEGYGVPRPRLDGAIAMAVSDNLACGLTGQGDVVCWGQAVKDWHRYERQFAQQPTQSAQPLAPLIVPDPAVDELPDVVEVGRFRGAVGIALSNWNNLCVVRADAKLACSSNDVVSLMREQDLGMRALDGAAGVAAVSTTRTHACARTLDDRALCWGRNVYGQLGDGGATTRESAAPVAGLEGVLDISVAENFSCALTRDDQIACWGFDLGEGLGHEALSAHTLEDLRATSIAASGHTSCAVDNQGALRCWGSDMLEQVGIVNATTPVAITLPSSGEVLGFNTGWEGCFLLSGGALECGSWSAFGSAAGFSTNNSMTNVSAFAAGAPPFCTIEGHGRNAALRCGQSFNQLQTDRQIKAPTAISSTHMRGCVVHGGGRVSCFAELYFWDGKSPPPREFTRLEAITDAVAVSSSSAHDCALQRSGQVSCWVGHTETEWSADGQTAKANHYRPTQAKDLGLERVTQLVAGTQHHCALSSRATPSSSPVVRCWADNPYGEDTVWRPVPELGDVVELAAGTDHTCARTSAGRVTCWGDDIWGQLGRVPARVHLSPTTMQIQ